MTMTEIRQTSAQVTLQCEHAGPIVYNHFPRYTILLGSVQIVSGVVLLVLGIACVFLGVYTGAYGVQLFFSATLAGAFGVAAGRGKTICKIITSMIFSILTSISSCLIVVILGFSLLQNRTAEHYTENYTGEETISEFELSYQQYRARTSMGRTILIFVFLAAVMEAAASIAISAIGSHFSCFCCKNCCCKFDLTTTEKVIVRDFAMEQQLQLLGAAARAPTAADADTEVQNLVKNCGKDREQLLQPPSYYYDV